MSRQNFTEGQEIVTQDLNAISQGLEETLLDNVIWPLIAAAAGFFGNGFYVTYDSSTGVTVSEGWGIQRDANQSDPEPMTRILVNDDDSTIYAIETPDVTNDRIDIVQVKWEIVNGATGTREFKAAGGSVGDATAQLRKDWSADIQIKTGTPAGSPSAPSVDIGYVKIAELYVTASTGIANQAAITDSRSLIKTDFHLQGEINASQATAHSLSFNSPEDILIDSPSGVVNQDLPSANVRAGKRFTLRASGMDSSNYVVLRSSDGDTIHAFNYCATTGEGYITVVALQNNPTDSSHWKIVQHWAYLEVDFRSSGDFTTNVNNRLFVTIENNKNVIAHTKNSIIHTSKWNPTSGVIIPTPLIPGYNAQNVSSHSSQEIAKVIIDTSGQLVIQYREYDGTTFDTTGTPSITLFWQI